MQGLDLPIREHTVIRAEVRSDTTGKHAWWGPLVLAGGRWWTITGVAFRPDQLRDWETLAEAVH